MKKDIIPAVIATTQEELDGIFLKIGGHASLIQLDIMDGEFVPNRSLFFDFKLPMGKYRFEAHLMIKDPDTWMEENWEKVDTLIAHFEPLKDPSSFIKRTKTKGKKAAFALNPETSVAQVTPYLKDLDQVLVMTVHPGFYGSPFLPETLDKIRELRQLMPELDIEVDGGIKPGTVEQAAEAGANLFVSGSYLIQSDSFQERMDIMKQKAGTG